HARQNRIDRLRRDWDTAGRAISGADSGKEHAKKVVDLGDRADGAAWVGAGRFLADRNRRAQAGDEIDVWFGHLAHELAGVVAQAFDVSPLALGVKGVKGQRAFAAARHTAEADQLPPRQRKIDVP